MKLQIFISQSGYCSRRKSFDLIKGGFVSINGRIVLEPSSAVTPEFDEVRVDNKRIKLKTHQYVLFNKPSGCITSRTAQGKDQKTIYHYIPGPYKHLLPVGRLDKDTEGLLILTNDGDLTYRLTHPRYKIDKSYLVKTYGCIDQHDQKKLEEGIMLEGKKTSPAKILKLKNLKNTSQFIIVIHEGRKRQIRLMVRSLNKKVTYLKRVQHGPLPLGTLKKGSTRPLTLSEVKALKSI